jgi:hypothetical protein
LSNTTQSTVTAGCLCFLFKSSLLPPSNLDMGTSWFNSLFTFSHQVLNAHGVWAVGMAPAPTICLGQAGVSGHPQRP